MAVIRVVLADDQLLVRSGFAALLRVEAGITVVGEADDGAAAVTVVAETVPDVVLMDVRMPGLDGIEATRRIVADERLSGVRVVMLTTFDLDEYVFDALRAGASGFLLKHTAPADLLQAVRVVAAGDALLSPSVTRRLIAEFTARPTPSLPRADGSAFTEREHEVVQRVAQGMSNEEIAREFFISAATVRTHVSRAMSKVHARDRAQLVVFAYRTGMVRA
ncbi:response regulator [Amycolatopsis sp. NPDC049868]|uniref:response regulator n=1 Tax=Amycolatopsis sp. NPDC049868 TaxID=3363934 RepID=UPI00378FC16F